MSLPKDHDDKIPYKPLTKYKNLNKKKIMSTYAAPIFESAVLPSIRSIAVKFLNCF